MALFAEVWVSQGIQVNVSAGCNYIPADMAIVHVDSTVVGDEYLELAARYRVALNGRVKDISKTSFSRQLLKREDHYDGRVIVKTDANYGGKIEYGMGLQAGESLFQPEGVQRPWRKREFLDSYNYPVFDSIRDVPAGVWKNSKLIVEKFLPEIQKNGDYRQRNYLFLGSEEEAMWFDGPQEIVKSSVSTSGGVLEQIPVALREKRKDCGFDFGRFDYTEIDGEVNLFDMNKTPALGEIARSHLPDEKIRAFAEAIADFE
jgi:hypothetical protein